MRKPENLTNEEKKLLGLALFSLCMKYGPKLFKSAQEIATKLDLPVGDFAKNWIDYSKKKDSPTLFSVKCPECGGEDCYDKIRQYPEEPGVADIGWRCGNCNLEFGFELSADSHAP